MESDLPKKFCDDPANIVNESIDGLIKSSGGKLKRLDGYDKNIRVVVRADYEENIKNANKVALVSGGGSGHEPAFTGFVGEGMLAAAVCGDVFASPTTDAVLAAIKAVTGPAGCLLIIHNYTGDRLNFGLAAEKARSIYGLKVESVVIADDVAIPESRHPRGMSGTLFVHRFAGRLAEAGKPLDEVYDSTTKYELGTVSVGASLSTCNLPGVKKDTRLDGPVYELGLGMHGEPGAATLPYEEASGVLDRMQKILIAGLERKSIDKSTNEFTLLLNNLGSVPAIEMTFLFNKVVEILGSAGIKISHVASGHCFTSFGMNGFTLTLAAHPTGSENPLLGDCEAPVWPGIQAVIPAYQSETQLQSCCLLPVILPEEETFEGRPKLSEELKETIKKAMNAIIAIEPDLTEWDQKSGDGDCGHTFKKGANSILQDLENYPNHPAQLCQALSQTISHSMGGSSGVLLAMFFMAAGADICANAEADPLTTGFRAGVKSVMHYGGASVGSCTMVDALAPAMEGTDISSIAQLAKIGAESTKEIRAASHGRSQYLAGTDLSGIPDPGAVAIATILEALSN